MNYEFGQAVVTNTSVNPRISGRMTDWSLFMMKCIFLCWNTMKLGRWAPTFRMSVLCPSSEYERFWRWCQDGESIFLRHVGARVPNLTASHFRRQVFMVISVGTISDVFTNLTAHCHFWLRSVGWCTDSVNWKGCVEKRSWPVCVERRWGGVRAHSNTKQEAAWKRGFRSGSRPPACRWRSSPDTFTVRKSLFSWTFILSFDSVLAAYICEV
jgi:hypothetical protein